MDQFPKQKVRFGKILSFVLFWQLLLIATSNQALARDPRFDTPASLRGAVDFWIQVYTQYGKHQLVFHHRDDPAIIYSVLDFRELAATESPGRYVKLKEEEVDRETERIQAELLGLANGNGGKSVWAKRVERLFDRFGYRDKAALYRDAAQVDQIRTQSGVRELFSAGLKRSGQYLPAIEAIFTERGLPAELGRVPFVESSFNYEAYSSVGAAGIWQFMRSTAKSFMRVGSAIDERRDPIISTRAAASYISRAYSVLGTWPLAITSYNHGITGVLRASKTVGTTDIARLIREYDGKAWGFASKNFYAEFLAALEVEREHKRYFPELIIDRPVYFDEIQIGSNTEFGKIVEASGLSYEEFEHLNPALRLSYFGKKSVVPASVFVKVPYGKAASLLLVSRGSVMTWQFGPSGGKHGTAASNSMKRLEADRPIKSAKGKAKAKAVRKSSFKPAVVKKVVAKKPKAQKSSKKK
jgi:membrane-bound lytic murein transglycosylase D